MDWTTLFVAVVVVVLCIAPAAVRSQHPVPALRAGGTLRARRQRVILLWKRATAYVLRVLRLRRKWASLGRYLQAPRIQDLVVGLSRRTGTLTRIYDASFVEGPQAKIRAQPSRRNIAATTESR